MKMKTALAALELLSYGYVIARTISSVRS